MILEIKYGGPMVLQMDLETHNWYAKTHLAIDQGPIVVMIENYRSGLLWNLFMKIPDVQNGLKKLGFTSKWIK